MATTQRTKPFFWSYSKLKNFETCPKRHYEVDVAKHFKDEEGEQLAYGNALHKEMAARLSSRTPLSAVFARHEHWAQRVEHIRDAHGAELHVERKLAITREFAPCEFFDRRVDVWFRGVGDVILLIPAERHAVVLDWKTGKVLEDSQQLALTAQCILSHHPEIQWVTAMFIWMQHNAETTEHFTRGSDGAHHGVDVQSMPRMWIDIWPRVQAMENAHVSMNYPATPSGLCKRYCPVTSCEYHGRGSY